MDRFCGFGLRLESQLPIPGGIPDCRADTAPPDVRIVCNAAEPGHGARGYSLLDAGILFSCFGVARYAIQHDRIAVTPEPDVDPELVSAVLVATALPALLWMRGQLVIHAAAALLPGAGSAIAIAGASGSGKSTILAQLAEAGAQLIGDDSIAISLTEGRASATGLPGGWFAPAARGDARRFFPAPANATLAVARLGGILVLEPLGDAPPDITRLVAVEAVKQLLAHRHRPRAATQLGIAAEVLRNVSLLASTIPLYSWRRRAGVASLASGEWAMLERVGTGSGD